MNTKVRTFISIVQGLDGTAHGILEYCVIVVYPYVNKNVLAKEDGGFKRRN